MTLSNYLLIFPCYCRWVLIFYNTGETLICIAILVIIDLNKRTVRIANCAQGRSCLGSLLCCGSKHKDIMTFKCLSHYWHLLRGFTHGPLWIPLTKGQWCRDFTFSEQDVEKWNYGWLETPWHSGDFSVMTISSPSNILHVFLQHIIECYLYDVLSHNSWSLFQTLIVSRV